MSTAYSRTTRARRRRLHLAAAAVGPQWVADDELPGYLARHLYLAGRATRALTALEAAVEDALTRGAHDEALLHLYRDLELRRSDDIEAERRAVLPDRLVVTGELLELLGRYDEAEPHFREAIEKGAASDRLPRADRIAAPARPVRRRGRDRGRGQRDRRPRRSPRGSGSAGRRRRRWPPWARSTRPSPRSCPASTRRPRRGRT